jgi:ABC-type transporter Mla subunit MlaD
MWNPLSLPLAALGVAASLPRVLEGLARTPELLERAVDEASGLNESADEARQLLTAGLDRMDALNERADLVLEELAEARAVFAGAMLKLDRLSDQGDRVTAQVADAERLVASLTAGGDDLVAAAGAAREQLRETQMVLERASDQFARALEMAEPFDRMTSRAARIAGSLRRDAGDE